MYRATAMNAGRLPAAAKKEMTRIMKNAKVAGMVIGADMADPKGDTLVIMPMYRNRSMSASVKNPENVQK